MRPGQRPQIGGRRQAGLRRALPERLALPLPKPDMHRSARGPRWLRRSLDRRPRLARHQLPQQGGNAPCPIRERPEPLGVCRRHVAAEERAPVFAGHAFKLTPTPHILH